MPAGYAGDFSVSASHDDRMYSDDYKEWQIRPCTMPEIVRLATPKLNMKLYASVEEFEALGTEVLELELTRKSPAYPCLLYTSPSPRDRTRSRMPSSA